MLPRSAWAQAVGSLLSTVSLKIIADVKDVSNVGADEAYRIAKLIAKVVTLDDLFRPAGQASDVPSVTAHYTQGWLRLQFLSEVLQSDLKEVQWLWFESDLSLEFSAEEVVELILMSFEYNYRTREVISKIKAAPHPRAEESEQ